MSIDGKIYIKKQQTWIAIRLENIIYLEKYRRQIIVHTAEGEDICFYSKFDAVTPMLDERFTHPHQSYIINMQHIRQLGNHEVVMYGGDRIVLGNKCFAKLKRAYDAFVSENIRSKRKTKG